MCFKIRFYFSLSNSDLIGNKWNKFFPKVESVLPMTLIGEWFSCPYLNPGAFHYISSPSWGGEWEQFQWALGIQPGSAHGREMKNSSPRVISRETPLPSVRNVTGKSCSGEQVSLAWEIRGRNCRNWISHAACWLHLSVQHVCYA